MKNPKTIRRWFNLAHVVLLVLIVLLVRALLTMPGQAPKIVSYSEFRDEVRAGHVTEVEVTDKSLTGKLKAPSQSQPGGSIVAVRLPANDDHDLIKELEDRHIKTSGRFDSATPWADALFSWLIPLMLLVGLYGFAMRRMTQGGGNALTFGKNKAKIHDQSETINVTFADVAGIDEAKAELEEVIDFLRQPQKYQKLGGRIPKGVLLVGPPGTGKTLLAKAVAGEAGVSFFSISGSEFVEMFVGVGAARVRDLFEQARGKAPCIVFIDELDAIGKSRTAGRAIGFANDEREQTLNQLLAEMDGFDTSSGVILMAATNTPEVLDAALLRAGRFDRQVLVDRPDLRDRVEI